MSSTLKIVALAGVLIVLGSCGGGGGSSGTTNTGKSVTTLAGVAGSNVPWADGTGTAARFNKPFGITTDGTNLYIADTYNNVIRKIVIATGAVSTIAGIVTVAGFADGVGTAATFSAPTGITTDSPSPGVPATTLYVTDFGSHLVRKIDIASATVTTLAGVAGSSGSADGTGKLAAFNSPAGITTDGTNLYVADYGNNTIRKIVISSGVVTTIAGTAGVFGSDDGIGTLATFSSPFGITTDGTNLYVADQGTSTIRKIVIATAAVTRIAGFGYSGTVDGIGLNAAFFGPQGIITDRTNLYISDTGNNTIRQMVISSGAVTTIVGTAMVVGSADGAGGAASFNAPAGITTDGTNLYVADTNNSTIRKIH